jgi:hypothetical protein
LINPAKICEKYDDTSDAPNTGTKTNFTAPRPSDLRTGSFSSCGMGNHWLIAVEMHRCMTDAAAANAVKKSKMMTYNHIRA